jgi:uncharacterized protein (DUF1697 family)
MRTHVALLRGINVGGRNKLAMADLRQVLSDLGHTEVATYIQSGNALFAAADPSVDGEHLAVGLETAIAGRLGLRPRAVVISRDRLRQVVAGNPYADEADPKAVHAVFLREGPTADGISAVAAAVDRARAKGSRERAEVVGGTLYLWTPDGLGRSVLAVELNRVGERSTPMSTGTARNWATVEALMERLDG